MVLSKIIFNGAAAVAVLGGEQVTGIELLDAGIKARQLSTCPPQPTCYARIKTQRGTYKDRSSIPTSTYSYLTGNFPNIPVSGSPPMDSNQLDHDKCKLKVKVTSRSGSPVTHAKLKLCFDSEALRDAVFDEEVLFEAHLHTESCEQLTGPGKHLTIVGQTTGVDVASNGVWWWNHSDASRKDGQHVDKEKKRI